METKQFSKQGGFTPHLECAGDFVAESKWRIPSEGFTLIEILISLGILFGLVFIIAGFGMDIADMGLFLNQSLSSQQELQQIMKQIKSELRSIGPSNIGSYAIERADADSLIFYSDIDGDQLFERVRYYLENGIIKKGIIKPTGSPLSYQPVNETITEAVHNVSSGKPIFNYYPINTAGGSPLAVPADTSLVRLINVDVTVDENGLRPPGPDSLSIFATIRNLRGVQ